VLHRFVKTSVALVIAVCAVLTCLALFLAGCSSDTREEKFCNQLEEFSNPQAAVSAQRTLLELQELQTIVPLEIRRALEATIDIFDEFVSTQDPETARSNLTKRASEIAESAATLDAYAVRQCGFSLERILVPSNSAETN